MSCCASPLASPEFLQETASRLECVEQERIISASTDLGSNQYKTEFTIPEMHCSGCISAIERGLADLPLVGQVRANLSLKSVSVIWDAKLGSATDITNKLDKLGFDHHLSDPASGSSTYDLKGRSLLLSLAVAGFAAANIMLLSVSVWSGADQETTQLFHLISGLIAIPAVFFAGRPFFKSAAKALSMKRLNMDVPISLAVLLALGMSVHESLVGGEEAYFDASVTLLFFLLIGRYLDHLMRQKARGAVERLSSLSAKDGMLVDRTGEISHIGLKDILPGMHLRVFAGERFPVNGEIISGRTELDRSHVSGESESIVAGKGALIEAGTLNMTASVDIKATTSAEDSFLAEMRNMMEAAEQGRGNYVRIADRMASIYAPAVHLLALIAFIGWMVVTGGDWHTSLYTAIAVLIVTCPCALGLAVPVAHVIGANRLMQNGILMRDGTALERLATINSVVFDKTGTLTNGAPVVTGIHGLDESDIPVLKALSRASGHPIAKAINRSIQGDWQDLKISDVKEIPGFGIEAKADGKQIRLGKPDWVAVITETPSVPSEDNQSVSFAVAGSPAAYFELEDELRPGAREVVGVLSKRGLGLEILSGDSFNKVSALARKVGIQQFLSAQTPGDKIGHITSRKEAGDQPLMVGDGINDAPALAAGHVSMVPASASDVGRHAADFVFTRNSLEAVSFAFDTARATDQIVKQNFGLAIAYNCIAVPLALAGLVTPLVAAIAMSASSIVVVANSFRINLSKHSKTEQERDSVIELSETLEAGV